jgi:hypothetical protein
MAVAGAVTHYLSIRALHPGVPVDKVQAYYSLETVKLKKLRRYVQVTTKP